MRISHILIEMKPAKKEYDVIPKEEIPEGIACCIQNSLRLFDDAKFLFENNRFSNAVVNLILAKEELAKAHKALGSTCFNPVQL